MEQHILTYAIILLVAGILLAFLETILPSGGLLGFLAAASLIGAVVIGFMHGEPAGWLILLAIFICVPVLITLGLKVLPKTPFGRRMILAEPHEKLDPSGGKIEISDENFSTLKGKTGVTVTELRPSGIAEINGKRYSVVSEGEMIDSSVEIIVKEVEGNSIIVRKKNV
jgi:membrane-bound serine protease (ClpP class)